MNPRDRDPTLLERFLALLLMGALGTFFAYVLLLWASGCGESYVDAAGVTHVNHCPMGGYVP